MALLTPLLLLFLRFYFHLFTDTEREAGRETGRGRSRLPTGSPMLDSILDPLGSGPEPKADAQPLSHPGVLLLLPWKRTWASGFTPSPGHPSPHPYLNLLIFSSSFSVRPTNIPGFIHAGLGFFFFATQRRSWIPCLPYLCLPKSAPNGCFLLSSLSWVYTNISNSLVARSLWISNRHFKLILFLKVHHLASQSYFPSSIFPILLKNTFIPQSVQGRSTFLLPFVQISWGTKCYQIYFLIFNSITHSLSIHGPCINWGTHPLWSRWLSIPARLSLATKLPHCVRATFLKSTVVSLSFSCFNFFHSFPFSSV